MLQQRKRIPPSLQLPLVLPINNPQEPIHLEAHRRHCALPRIQIHARKRDELLHWDGDGRGSEQEIHLRDVAPREGSRVLDGDFKREGVALREGVLSGGVEVFLCECCVRAVRG